MGKGEEVDKTSDTVVIITIVYIVMLDIYISEKEKFG
jgi:hypothetical protein